MVGVAALLTGNGNGTCDDARIALFGVDATPVRMEQAEAMLKGARLDNRILVEAASVVAEVLEPDSDIHASADYRKDVAGVLWNDLARGIENLHMKHMRGGRRRSVQTDSDLTCGPAFEACRRAGAWAPLVWYAGAPPARWGWPG